MSGTGTGIGKTHFSEAFLLALGVRASRVAGLKPIETGMGEPTVSDAARLERVSTFHVKPSGYVFADAVSPHLAAREADTPIRFDVLLPLVEDACATVDVLLVELPGGLFTPLSDAVLNVDLALALSPDLMLLVAPDRLGVLHEVLSTTRAALSAGLEIDALVLMTPEAGDTSTGLNARELERLVDIPVAAALARGTPRELAADPDLGRLSERVLQD